MDNILGQMAAVISMNIRSLPQRVWMSLATILAVAVVVAVLLAFLSMANGFKMTVAGSGSDALAIVMRSGAQAELNSVLMRDQINILKNEPVNLFLILNENFKEQQETLIKMRYYDSTNAKH